MTYVPKNEDGSTMDIYIHPEWLERGPGVSFQEWRLEGIRARINAGGFNPADQYNPEKLLKLHADARWLLAKVDRLLEENQDARAQVAQEVKARLLSEYLPEQDLSVREFIEFLDGIGEGA